MKVLALVGMTGSGKSTVSDVLKEKGCGYVRFGQVTIDEIEKRNLEVNEKNERIIREEFREKYGMDAFAKLNVDRLDKELEKGNVIADGLYSWEEYLFLKNHYKDKLVVIAVYSSPKTRYKRLATRKVRSLTTEEAFSRDKAEIENSHKAGPIAMADFTLNNENSLEDLKRSVEWLWKKLEDF